MAVHLNTSSLSTCFLLTLPLQSGRRRTGYLSEGRHGLVVRCAERTERTFPVHVCGRAACFHRDEVLWSLVSKEHVMEKVTDHDATESWFTRAVGLNTLHAITGNKTLENHLNYSLTPKNNSLTNHELIWLEQFYRWSDSSRLNILEQSINVFATKSSMSGKYNFSVFFHERKPTN